MQVNASEMHQSERFLARLGTPSSKNWMYPKHPGVPSKMARLDSLPAYFRL
jgi:hypothetical protein